MQKTEMVHKIVKNVSKNLERISDDNSGTFGVTIHIWIDSDGILVDYVETGGTHQGRVTRCLIGEAVGVEHDMGEAAGGYA